MDEKEFVSGNDIDYIVLDVHLRMRDMSIVDLKEGLYAKTTPKGDPQTPGIKFLA